MLGILEFCEIFGVAGCGVVRGWVCGGRDFFIFSFILVAQAWCLRFYSFILRLFNLSLVLLKLW